MSAGDSSVSAAWHSSQPVTTDRRSRHTVDGARDGQLQLLPLQQPDQIVGFAELLDLTAGYHQDLSCCACHSNGGGQVLRGKWPLDRRSGGARSAACGWAEPVGVEPGLRGCPAHQRGEGVLRQQQLEHFLFDQLGALGAQHLAGRVEQLLQDLVGGLVLPPFGIGVCQQGCGIGGGVGERGEQAEQLAVGRVPAVFDLLLHHPHQPRPFGVGFPSGAGGLQQARAGGGFDRRRVDERQIGAVAQVFHSRQFGAGSDPPQ